MVSEKCLAQQANRLFKLPFAPSSMEDQRNMLDEFKRVLRDRVISEAHCKAVIDYLIDHAGRCPPPLEVIAATEEVKAPDKAKAPLGCSECHGSGYVEGRRQMIGPLGQFSIGWAKPCGCALGQFIQPEYDKRKNKAVGASREFE